MTLFSDIRYGFRMLVKRPGLSATAIIALALGIGLTTTMFGIVYGVVIRGLPYEESEKLIGLFRAPKDYLHPALAAAAMFWFGGFAGEEPQKTASVGGPIYCLLFLGAGIASRNAHRFQSWAGGEAAAARNLWGIVAVVFLVLSGASAMQLWSVVIVSFVALYMLQNLWRPILTSRVYGQVEEAKGATMLSVESQTQRLSTIALAPLFGWMFDTTGSLWPIAGLAAVIALGFWGRSPARSTGV